MEIMLWKPSACIKRKFYCYEDFTEPLAFFLASKTINRKNKEIKISCIKFLYTMESEWKYKKETHHYT